MITGGNIMFCANCGSKLPEGAKFCGGCGAKTEPVQPDYTASVEPAPMRPNQSPSVYPPPTQTVKNMPRDDAKAIVKDLVENGKTKNSMPWAENLFTPESINLTNNIYSIFDTLVDTMSSFTELTSMQMRFTADKVSKGVSVAGLGISLTQLGIDLYYSNGNDRTAAVNLYKNVFTSSGTLFTYMTGYGSLPFSAAFLGAAVLAFGLDYGVQTAEEYKDTVNKAIFDQYYRDYAKFDEQYWYKLFAGTYIDAWQNGKASAEGAEVAYKTVLDAMEENTQKFWADVFREGSDALTFACRRGR